ncbi:MAG: hypothetical protein ABJC19_06370 [Gemmatimonadota bacterium]
MEPSALPWLDSLVGTVAAAAVALLFVVNGAFAVGVLITRNRRFVDAWTKPLVMVDAALVTAAIGAPVLGVAAKLGTYGLGLMGFHAAARVAIHK